MNIEFKDLFFLAVGTVVGFIFGIAIYWLPLRQFINECAALVNLMSHRYREGDHVVVRSGVDMMPLDVTGSKVTTLRNCKVQIWNDEGIGWHHTHDGWKRVRILHVFETGNSVQNVYKVCHLDLIQINIKN